MNQNISTHFIEAFMSEYLFLIASQLKPVRNEIRYNLK